MTQTDKANSVRNGKREMANGFRKTFLFPTNEEYEDDDDHEKQEEEEEEAVAMDTLPISTVE